MSMSVGQARNRISGINVTPMADVIIVLLIIFMVTTPLINSGRVRHLPTAQSAIAKKETPLTVWITAEAIPYFNEVPVLDLETLREQLRMALAASTGDRVVYVKAEAALPYSVVGRVVDQCRLAGASEVALIAAGATSRRPPL
jgi:biopolymer transport protein TolR